MIEIQQTHIVRENTGIKVYLYHDKGLTIYRLDNPTTTLLPNDQPSIDAFKDLLKDLI
jgi:hypothetical protein